jgi:hypothetical protein
MASWLSRKSQQTAHDAATRHRLYDAPLEGLPGGAAGFSVAGAVGLRQGEPSSSDSSETDIHPQPPRLGQRPRRPQHSRSLSHPFPSLFAPKKKRQPDNKSDQDSSESEWEAGAAPMIKGRGKTDGRSQRSGHGRVGSHDFVNGNCMTCSSLLRWPRDLPVFRCTVCLTINDIGPRPGGPGSAGWEERIAPRTGGTGGAIPAASLRSAPTPGSKSRMHGFAPGEASYFTIASS